MSDKLKIEFTLDGTPRNFEAAADARLLDLLREQAGITAVREGCGEGECGACSVFKDGRLVNSCCLPAVSAHGSEIITIEGFSKTDEYRIISEAYTEAGAVQCGFCTPGFIMATAALLKNTPRPSRQQIREGLSGNLCRCTGYSMIIDAVEAAAERMAADD